jgi:peptidoglycan hydrolase-like protein with peptidoglycan-binding domain
LACNLTIFLGMAGVGNAIVLQREDSGSDVFDLQDALTSAGFYVPATGYYGDLTEEAVLAFQQAHGLVADGIAGPETLAVLGIGTVATSDIVVTSNSSSLAFGDRGSAVFELQAALNNSGYSVPVDGVFGELTQNAVLAFQQDANLFVDGVVGSETLAALNGESAQNDSVEISSGTLKLGDQGSAVVDLQVALNNAGYFLLTDGDFGAATQEALLAFQQDSGLIADGVAGPETFAMLSEELTQTSDSGIASETLELGDRGSAVEELQTALAVKGYYTGAIDGDFGEQTETAVVAFQQDMGLVDDGIAGYNTAISAIGDSGGLISIASPYSTASFYSDSGVGDMPGGGGGSISSSLLAEAITQTDTLSTKPFDPSLSEVVIRFNDEIGSNISATMQVRPNVILAPAKRGIPDSIDSGPLVDELQLRLSDLGCFRSRAGIEGYYNGNTTIAVENFQSSNDLPVDGVAGSETLSKLFGGTSSACDSIQLAGNL